MNGVMAKVWNKSQKNNDNSLIKQPPVKMYCEQLMRNFETPVVLSQRRDLQVVEELSVFRSNDPAINTGELQQKIITSF